MSQKLKWSADPALLRHPQLQVHRCGLQAGVDFGLLDGLEHGVRHRLGRVAVARWVAGGFRHRLVLDHAYEGKEETGEQDRRTRIQGEKTPKASNR